MQEKLFKPDRCDFCGKCLWACPVLGVEPERAGELVRRLAAGGYVDRVLDRCTGCMSCNALCETGADPYGLLLDVYHRRYLAAGIPGVFRGAMPGRSGPNLWRELEKWLSPRERRNLALWSGPPESEEVIFLGCNQRLTPYIADTPLLEGVPIFTDPEQCCGEFYFRLGLREAARQKALSLSERFSELGIRRVIAFCPACQNTMMNLMPENLGVRFDVEVVSLIDWLYGRVESGDIEISRPISATVTVQDPCHASGLEPRTLSNVRTLLRLAGLEIKEMENAGVLAECCGLGASLCRYRLTDVIRTGYRRIRQTRATGAEMTCAWCNGCYMVMNMFRVIHPQAPPVYHLLEILELASGGSPVRKMPARAFQLLAAATEAAARDGFNFSRVHI